VTKLTIITDKLVGMSIDLIADSLKAAAEAKGVPTTIVRAGKAHDDVHQANVISLIPMEIERYAPAFRFVHPQRFTTVIAPNWEERELPDQLKLMAYHLAPKWAGVPVQLIAHSPHTVDQVTKCARSTLSPSAARAFGSQFKAVFYGIEDGFEPGDNNPDSLVAPFNRWNQTQKQANLHSEITRNYQVMAKARGLTVISTFYRAQTDIEMFGYKPEMDVHITMEQPATRDEYRANARKHGMFLCTSKFESFGIYFLELLASGVVGVFLDAPWHQSLLPGYRYTAKAQNLAAMMMHVRENYQEARRYLLETIRPMILDRYTVGRFNETLLSIAQGGAVWTGSQKPL
jgi:hypothetical protein